jgi:hypothetical protein
MITRLDITPAEFERRKDRLRSRWTSLIESLRAGEVGDVFPIALRADENNAETRRAACQSIRAIAGHHGFSIRLSYHPTGILVMKRPDKAIVRVLETCAAPHDSR